MANRPYDNWGIQKTSWSISRSLHFHVPSMFLVRTKHIQRQFYSPCSKHLKPLPMTVEILANPLAHMHNLTIALSFSLTVFKVFTASTSLTQDILPDLIAISWHSSQVRPSFCIYSSPIWWLCIWLWSTRLCIVFQSVPRFPNQKYHLGSG